MGLHLREGGLHPWNKSNRTAVNSIDNLNAFDGSFLLPLHLYNSRNQTENVSNSNRLATAAMNAAGTAVGCTLEAYNLKINIIHGDLQRQTTTSKGIQGKQRDPACSPWVPVKNLLFFLVFSTRVKFSRYRST